MLSHQIENAVRAGRPTGRRTWPHGRAVTPSIWRDASPRLTRYHRRKPGCAQSSNGLQRGEAMANALRHDIDERHRHDQHQQDRADIGVIKLPDGDEQILADASGSDEPDD